MKNRRRLNDQVMPWMAILFIAVVCWASGPQVVGQVTRWAMQVTEATTLQGTQIYGVTVQ